MNKIIVVGSGFSGSIISREIAEKLNMKVDIIEKRDHIGGNAYDEYDENGILIQKYGPHFLNTNNYNIIKYLKRFSDLFAHDVKLMSFIDEKYVQLPFNYKTLQQLVGYENSEKLLKKMRKYFKGRDRVPIFELLDCRDLDIKKYGNLLFEKAFRTYTSKQWGKKPEEIEQSVINRVQMAMNFDERYLNKDFQFLPINGFTKMFESLLLHENIRIHLKTDAIQHIKIDDISNKILYDNNEIGLLVYTGPIDELFNFKYGKLPYRSLEIKYNYYDCDSYLPREVISYPQAEGYTRATEYKKITYNCKSKKTVIATEYPCEYDRNNEKANIPYYPTLTKDSIKQYNQYLEESKKYDNLVLCGRLAEFKYYNMDVCIEHALEKYEEIKKRMK